MLLQAGHASLPHCIWHRISLLVYGDGTCPRDVLCTRAALMLISKEVAAATRKVPLQLDLRAASDLAAVKALLATAPVSQLWLCRDMRGDEILRDPGMRRQSCGSLRELSASISCTDTLQAFRNLDRLHLQVGGAGPARQATLPGRGLRTVAGQAATWVMRVADWAGQFSPGQNPPRPASLFSEEGKVTAGKAGE